MQDRLTKQLEQFGLTANQLLIEKLIDAYQAYPDSLDIDDPQEELIRFFELCQDVPSEECAVRLRHQISKLSLFQARAFKSVANGSAFFNPLEQDFTEFKGTDEVQFYTHLQPFPTADIILKALQA